MEENCQDNKENRLELGVVQDTFNLVVIYAI